MLHARYEADRERIENSVRDLADILSQMEACFGIIVPDMTRGLGALDDTAGEVKGQASGALAGAGEQVEWEVAEEEDQAPDQQEGEEQDSRGVSRSGSSALRPPVWACS